MAPEPAASRRLALDALPAEGLDRLRQLARLTNGRAWLVGGPVRDALLGRPLLDYDLVVEADAAAVAMLLPARLIKTTAFGTTTVQWPDGSDWDIAGARAEHYPHPGSLPICRPAALGEDLARRDFSINALAASLDPETWGAIIDPYGGLEDLTQGVIRVLHDRSFADDPTRLFRAARYVARLGSTLHPDTAAQAAAAIAAGLVDTLTPARIVNELERSLGEHPGAPQIRAIAELGLWDAVTPGLDPDDSRLARLDELLAGQHQPLDWATRMAGLLPAEKPTIVARRLVVRLLPPRPVSEVWEWVAERLERGPWAADARPSEVAGELGRLPVAALPALAAHWPSRAEAVQSYRTQGRELRPELDGHDLLAAGVPPGPAVGRLLDRLRDARLDGEVTDRVGELSLVRRWLEEERR